MISEQGKLKQEFLEKESFKKGIKFETGDILFGKLRPYLKNWLFTSFNGIAVGDWWVFRPNKIDNKFTYYLIQTTRYQNAANLSTGTKMPRSDWNLVSKTKFNTPNNILEQKDIGRLLSDLEIAVNLQQDQLQFYKDFKNGLLQKLFPSNTEKTPILRFAEFNTNWKHRKLKDVALVTTGKAFNSKSFKNNGKYLVITNKNVLDQKNNVKAVGDHIDIDKEETKKYRLN